MSSDFDYSILEITGHRPWPMPEAPWLMTQTWNDLLFAHWRVKISELRKMVPEEFDLDLFDGEAWLGIVPFHMTNVGPRATPTLPFVSAFPELNVRTYVRMDDRPGVYFFSLDAGSRVAAATARTLLNLPYFTADMKVEPRGHRVTFTSARRSKKPARFRATYEPRGEPFEAKPGTLPYFLTERYCLFHRNRSGRPFRLDIHHPPWSLQEASVEIAVNTMTAPIGVELQGYPAMLHFARRQDVVAWAPVV